ncbi:MAG: alpha/beta hydrolase [Hyphomicrobiales bacterium]|nr:alpha/beta hydrolase [Hyphomicrobiales bacterium]
MTRAFDAPDWATLDQEARDRAYNNAAAVVDSPAIVARWEERSAAMREKYPASLGLRYGPRERNSIDFLKAADGAPTLVFIHGGYWQMRSKETFTFCSTGPMAHGFNVAHVGYTLAPDATLDDMAAEIHAGLDFLVGALPELHADPARLVISGWSAGAQLAAMGLSHPAVKAGLAISGIYDLAHMRDIYVNSALRLDEGGVLRNSPALQDAGPKAPLSLVAGSAELPLMRWQSGAFAAHRAMLGLPVQYEEIAGANHFTIMEELASPEGRITQLLTTLL